MMNYGHIGNQSDCVSYSGGAVAVILFNISKEPQRGKMPVRVFEQNGRNFLTLRTHSS